MRIVEAIHRAISATLLLFTGCGRELPEHVSHPHSHSVPGPNEALEQLFRCHHVEAKQDGEWVTFPGRQYRASAAIVQEQHPRPNFITVQLDVRLDLGDGRVLIESFMRMGTSRDKAVGDSFQNFTINSFHVLLRAFFAPSDEQVTTEEWNIAGKQRRVVVGNLGMRGTPPVPEKMPVEWFPTVESKLKAMPLAGGTHWVRIYYAQMNGKMMELEVLLDNDHWVPLKDSLKDIVWPTGTGFFSMRLFMVITDI